MGEIKKAVNELPTSGGWVSFYTYDETDSAECWCPW
jgi:hypothetical protein